MTVLSFVSQKGGVGKTTLIINVASLLARKYAPGRVAVVDIDAQANTTATFLGHRAAYGDDRPKGIIDLLARDAPIRDCIHSAKLSAPDSRTYTLDVIPSSNEWSREELVLVSKTNRERRLARALEPIRAKYDWILLDAPPTLGLSMQLVLWACTHVVVPVAPGPFELAGLLLIQRAISEAQQDGNNPSLKAIGVCPTKTDRTQMSTATKSALASHFPPEQIFPEIPTRTDVAKALGASQDVFAYEAGQLHKDPTLVDNSLSWYFDQVTKRIMEACNAKK